MPLTRYQVRNQYSLADPELFRAADKDDPEALLEGVAMAGLVGVLRQLGDLAEWVFHFFFNRSIYELSILVLDGNAELLGFEFGIIDGGIWL